METFEAAYLKDVLRAYRTYKVMSERAIAQVSDADLHMRIDPDANSIAIIVKHLAGNLRSRFRDFLTTDGEKPDRNRDGEFEMPERLPRQELLRLWEDAWTVTLSSIEALTPDDLGRTIYIRAEAWTVIGALNRLVTHTAYHVGQIVFLAKHFSGPEWQTLSIPKGKSAEYATRETQKAEGRK